MLRGIIICPDNKLSAALQDSLNDVGLVYISRTLTHYPNEAALMRVVRAAAPQVVFLSIESLSDGLEVAATLETNVPGIQVIAISRNRSTQVLEELIRTDVREFLSMPFQRANVINSLNRVQKLVDKKPPAINTSDRLYSFLPSKAGVGASTIALNASMAAAASPNTRVLLSDFDLNSGIIQFMLKIDAKYSVMEAARHAAGMDENIWDGLVAEAGGMDVLAAGDCDPTQRLETLQIQYLLDFARRQYKVLCVDLSGNMEQYALEIMQESKRIFLVCTPELPAMYLARKKYALLKALDLGDRVSLLLNRYTPGSTVGPKEIENTVGLPVEISFPNDYQGVHAALTAGKQVDISSKLGKRFRQLADLMLETKTDTKEQPRAWPEFFAVLASRYAQLTSK